MSECKRDIIIYLVIILSIHLLSHFMPFERASLAPDDYACLTTTNKYNSFDIVRYFTEYPDRPINRAIIELQGMITQDNANIGLAFIIISTILVQVAVFILIFKLTGNQFTAFLGSIIYCLLPNKLEVYQSPILFNSNLVNVVYISSFLCFVYFTEKNAKLLLVASLVLYTIGCFWKELGFFLPVLMILYAFVYNKKQCLKYVILFALPAGIYAAYRSSLTTSWLSSHDSSRHIDLSIIPMNVIDLIQNYVGRTMARIVIYGVYKFSTIELPWLIAIIVADMAIILYIYRFLKGKEIADIDKHIMILALGIFVIFLIPNLVNDVGGIGGRSLVIPSIGVSIFLLWLIRKGKRYWRNLLLAFIVTTLIISQGNAWTQVVACRINAAMYETLKEKKEALKMAKYIVIDTVSFAENIDFTWAKQDFNILNTYYGAQTFEDWGLSSMVEIVIGNYDKTNIYVATKPVVINNIKNEVTFAITGQRAYRLVQVRQEILPAKQTLVIGFHDVYNRGFNNGKRK